MATQRQNELGEILKPLTTLATQMLTAGVLAKNVVRHFTNKGLSLEVATNLVEVGIFQAEELLKNKIK